MFCSLHSNSVVRSGLANIYQKSTSVSYNSSLMKLQEGHMNL